MITENLNAYILASKDTNLDVNKSFYLCNLEDIVLEESLSDSEGMIYIPVFRMIRDAEYLYIKDHVLPIIRSIYCKIRCFEEREKDGTNLSIAIDVGGVMDGRRFYGCGY